jgi:hypothetical protein
MLGRHVTTKNAGHILANMKKSPAKASMFLFFVLFNRE